MANAILTKRLVSLLDRNIRDSRAMYQKWATDQEEAARPAIRAIVRNISASNAKLKDTPS